VNLLYFWRGDNYRRDLDHGVGFHLNQASPLLHQIQIGHSLWAFTRRRDARYALAAELVVSARTMNPRGFRYGPYRVWGDLQRSRYFQIDSQPDISLLIRTDMPHWSLYVRSWGQSGKHMLAMSFSGF
jgi:hypothetical protein